MTKKKEFCILERGLQPREPFTSDDPSYLKLRKQHDDFVEKIRKKIVDSPAEVFESLLGALVNEPEKLDNLAPRSAKRYEYLAKHFLASFSAEEKAKSTYITFEQYCIEDTFGSGRHYFRLFNVNDEDFLESIFHELLEDYVDAFQNSIATVCNMVYRGLPLYVEDEPDTLKEVDQKDDRLIFIKGLGKYYYSLSDVREAPQWLSGLHLKHEDIDLFRLIFSQHETPSPEELITLMRAYRTSLGRPIDSSNSTELSVSPELSIRTAAATRARYLSFELVKATDLASRMSEAVEIDQEEAFDFMWMTIGLDDSFHLFRLGNGMPEDLGPAGFINEFADLSCEPKRYQAELSQFAFAKKDAERILFALRNRRAPETVQISLSKAEDGNQNPSAIENFDHIPGYLDPTHRRFAPKLAAAVQAWLAVEGPGHGTTTKRELEAWLRGNATRLGLINAEGQTKSSVIAECSAIANWDVKGGAPKTPGNNLPLGSG